MIERPVAQLTDGAVLARNTIWNVAGQAAPLLAAILAIPVILTSLGTERFGALSLAWVLIGYFSLFDLGLGRALTKLVAEGLADSREDEVPALAGTALALVLGLGVLAALLIVLPAGRLVDTVLRVPPELQEELRQALRLLGLSIPFVISTAALRGLLEARQRFGLVNAVRIPMGVFSFAGPVLVLPFSHSLVPVVAVLVAGRIMGWAIHLVLCFRVFPGLRQGLAFRPSLVRPLARLGGWMTVSNVVGPLMVYLDRVLIGALLGLAAVAYYSTPYEMVTRLLLVPLAIAQVLFPAFAGSLVTDPSRAIRLFDRGLKVTFLSFFPLALVLVTLAPELLGLWLGEEFARQSAPVLRWLAVGAFINGLAQVPFAFIQAAGRPELTARLHLMELPPYVAAVWGLIQVRGLEGAAMAWTARVVADTILLFVVAARIVPGSTRRGWRTGSVMAALLTFASGSGLDGLLTRGIFVALALLVFVGLSWRFVLSADERRLVRSLRSRVFATPRVGP